MATGEVWTTEELHASVQSYLDMLRKYRSGERFVKKDYYRELAARFKGRTAKAFEFRAQNISHVLDLLGREWIPGLLPAANVGANVVAKIESLLAEEQQFSNLRQAEFESKVNAVRGKKTHAVPIGKRHPQSTKMETTTFARDPEVKGWVLANAYGKCENCEQPAPFSKSNGQPYLEVHHIRSLVDWGTDTISNAVALCPNCHRAFHYSHERHQMTADLYLRVERLRKE